MNGLLSEEGVSFVGEAMFGRVGETDVSFFTSVGFGRGGSVVVDAEAVAGLAGDLALLIVNGSTLRGGISCSSDGSDQEEIAVCAV